MSLNQSSQTVRAPVGVVLGYGSIGRRHAAVLAPRVERLVIVNRREAVQHAARAAHPDALVTPTLDALDEARLPWERAAVVIATWGPSHAALFHALVDRGVRRVLCEKPMAASVADADCMRRRAVAEGVWLGLNHTLRYARAVPALRALAAAHALGEPETLVVEGGAACLLTNGIHWLDFAVELFDAAPESVVSTARGAPINPRSPELALYGGTAVWRFAGDREAVISFSNGSSLAPVARVHFRDAIAELSYAPYGEDVRLEARLARRDPEAVTRFPAVTRTGPAVVPVTEGALVGARAFMPGLEAAAEELLAGAAPTCGAAAGVAATEACIGALQAATDGRTVALPLDCESADFHTHWPIS